MTTIVTRAGKGSPLTNAEMDQNLINLNTAKLEGIVPIASGGTGQTNASDAFSALKQNATDTITGVVELATDAEAQAGVDTTRVLTPSTLKQAQIQLGTSVAASGTSFDFTGIPAWAKRVTLAFNGISTTGVSAWQVLLGTSSTFETSGYLGSNANIADTVTVQNETAYIKLTQTSAINTTLHGTLTLTKLSGNTWITTGVCGYSNGAANIVLGFSKTLSSALTRIRFATGNTTTWDTGTVNISWE